MKSKTTAKPIQQEASQGGRVMRQQRQEQSLKGKSPVNLNAEKSYDAGK